MIKLEEKLLTHELRKNLHKFAFLFEMLVFLRIELILWQKNIYNLVILKNLQKFNIIQITE